MGIVIDIIIILFILASAFFGYKKGLISLAINILAFITNDRYNLGFDNKLMRI